MPAEFATPTFCALMPNYNDAALLPRALMSLLNQTVPFDRIWIIDDGSTDHSLKILSDFQSRFPSIEVIRNDRNMGIMASINRGLGICKEEYVFLVSANDYFELNALELAKASIALAPSAVGLIGGQTRLIQPDGSMLLRTVPLPARPAFYDAAYYQVMLRRQNFSFFGGSVMVNRQYAIEAGGFLAQMKWHADWFLFALLASRHGFAYIPAIVGNMSVSPTQYSHAIHDWVQQSQLIAEYLRTLRAKYPSDYVRFKSMALLPSYDVAALHMLLREPDLRHYITPLLIWRLLTYKPARRIGRLMPLHLREQLRKLFKL